MQTQGSAEVPERGEQEVVVVVVQMINGNGVSVQARSYVQLIGWQNTWEQAPGVPATPSPPKWRGSTLAVYLCTRP